MGHAINSVENSQAVNDPLPRANIARQAALPISDLDMS